MRTQGYVSLNTEKKVNIPHQGEKWVLCLRFQGSLHCRNFPLRGLWWGAKYSKFSSIFIVANYFFDKWNNFGYSLLPGIRTNIPINSLPKVFNFSVGFRDLGMNFKVIFKNTMPFLEFYLQHSVLQTSSTIIKFLLCTMNHCRVYGLYWCVFHESTRISNVRRVWMGSN